MFINAKDAPFAVAMTLLLFGLVRAIEDYPRPGVTTIAIFGVGLGLTLGTRIMGGMTALYMILPMAVVIGSRYQRQRMRGRPRPRSRVLCPSPGPRPRARLCRHGCGLAVVGDRAAESDPRDRIFLALLREALEGMSSTARRSRCPTCLARICRPTLSESCRKSCCCLAPQDWSARSPHNFSATFPPAAAPDFC